MSATVDVSDSVDEARTRLLRTARALNGAWAALLCSMLSVVVASLVLLLVAVTVRPVYVVMWAVLLAAAAANVTRFWPRRPRRTGVLLDRDERAALRTVVDPESRWVWPEVVRLVPRAELELSEGELVVGLPLLASLDRAELRELVRVAVAQAEVEEVRSVRWALRLAHGDIGRPIVRRRNRSHWPTTTVTESVRSRAAALEADLGNWAYAWERAAGARSEAAADARAARDEVIDAWALLRTEWLDPAAARGRRHVAPFTGLRHFTEGAGAAGWLTRPRPYWPDTGVLADLVARHEETVALELHERGDQLAPLTWAEHPREVTVPQWRALVTETLDTARRTTRDDAVTLESVLRLVGHGLTADEPHADVVAARVLTAAISVAAVDAGAFTPVWAWPEGTRLDAEDGWTLPVQTIVTEVLSMARKEGGVDQAYAELREALDGLGIDVEEPLWLDHDPTARPERPIGSFVAREGLVARLVVVTDQTMHVFRDPHGPRLGRLLEPVSPRDAAQGLRQRMLAVWQGETADQVLAVSAAEVRRARIGPATGGLWWRLTLDCADRTVVLRGRGDGQPEERELREWLGRDLERRWLDTTPAVRPVRNAVGLAGSVLGALALLWAVLLTFVPLGTPATLPPALAVGGFGAVLVAVLPDAVVEAGRRLRRPRLTEPVSD